MIKNGYIFVILIISLMLSWSFVFGQSGSSENWKQQAAERITVSVDGLDVDSPEFQARYFPLERMRLIAHEYAGMYLSDPTTYKWAGLASLVVCEIHERFDDLRTEINLVGDRFVGPEANSSTQTYVNTILGNKAVYDDLFWQHLAYQNAGIQELESIYAAGELTDEAIQSWRLIEQGRQANNIELIWEGNRRLLNYEQEKVLQPIMYDGYEDFWDSVAEFAELPFPSSLVAPPILVSPVPGDTAIFTRQQGNFALFEDRWSWITGSILPAWRRYESNGSNLASFRMRIEDRCGTSLGVEIFVGNENTPLDQIFALLQDDAVFEGNNLLDLIFVIDTTGSMRDDIDAVRADAINIINQVAAGGTDWRIAIVTYRDHPVAPYGDPGDYVSNVDLPFSADQGEIVNRLNAIQVGGGGDTNEAVFAGLLTAIGQEWRPGSRKIIILMGDAPPHNPHPRDGYTRSMVLEAALAVDPANIYPIVIVDNNETRFEFQALADGSSGKLFYAADAVEVVPTILTTIGVAKGAQLVVGEAAQVASLMPEFPLRTGPTMTAAIIRNLPRSAVVTVIGGPELSIAETDLRQDFIWWQVRLEDGTEGWIPESTYGEPTLVPLSETSPLVEVTCTLTTIQGVNIRSGPGIQHEQIASRVSGELLAANGQNPGTEGFRWWQIIDGFWIREDLVRESGNCDDLPPVSPS